MTSGAELADVRRRNRERWPCKIKGCKRTAHRGDLCKGHYDLVPLSMSIATQMESVRAAHRVAESWHRKQLAHVRKVIREGK